MMPIPDVETPRWYYRELEDLEDLALLEDGGEAGVLHGEGDVQNPDDDIGRAWEDLEALTESA
jgi:hypothetical protein